MARKSAQKIAEDRLTKGQLRKLTALRKSLGESIADRAFAEWLESQPRTSAGSSDRNADAIVAALTPLINEGKLRIPRGGYLLRRGRQRVIVELPD
jgi:hypothetical protein